jgi:catechol 2,3-dioxygenase-like lactoylglutathione lyase family enzyme
MQAKDALFARAISRAKIPSMFKHEGIDHVALSVRDVQRSIQWYIDVLGFEKRYEGMWDGVPVFIGKGKTALAIFPVRENESGAAARPAPIRILHLALRADRANFLRAQSELKERGIKFTFQDHEISHSIYFRDPDGHELEITTYEVEGRAPSRP